jgi:hypothetical protein
LGEEYLTLSYCRRQAAMLEEYKSSLPLFSVLYSLYPADTSYLSLMVCRNICEKIHSEIIVGQSHYLAGKKYCRRCECYLITNKIFCPCCGMQLRTTPNDGSYKEKLREEKVIFE